MAGILGILRGNDGELIGPEIRSTDDGRILLKRDGVFHTLNSEQRPRLSRLVCQILLARAATRGVFPLGVVLLIGDVISTEIFFVFVFAFLFLDDAWMPVARLLVGRFLRRCDRTDARANDDILKAWNRAGKSGNGQLFAKLDRLVVIGGFLVMLAAYAVATGYVLSEEIPRFKEDGSFFTATALVLLPCILIAWLVVKIRLLRSILRPDAAG